MILNQERQQRRTAEEYRASAEAHRQAYKNQRKTFLKTGVIVIAAVFALFVLSMAWFANNSSVSADGIRVSANSTGFELRSYGTNGIYDEDILSQFFQYIQVGDGTSSLTTSGSSASISWLMSEDSNLGNYSEKEVHFTTKKNQAASVQSGDEEQDNNTQAGEQSSEQDDTQDRKNYAIEPGSEGHLTFYIVPGIDGTQTFDLQLTVSPYAATVDDQTNEIKKVTEVGGEKETSQTNKYAKQFISGHILFFLESEAESKNTETAEESKVSAETAEKSKVSTETAETTETTAVEYKWISDETFSVTIEDAEAGKEYGYTIYWKWPQVFSELILKEGDSYLNGRNLILTEAMRGSILKDMIARPEKYFYNSLTKSPLSTENKLVQDITNIHEKSPNAGGTEGYTPQNFVDLSSFYNQADQIIGSQISFIMVELSAASGGTQ